MKVTKKAEEQSGNLRCSNFELLRILCVFGIVSMHTFGAFYNSATGLTLVYGVFINSLFNTCVSIFMLISGYFGISFSLKKYLKLELEVLFYSILSLFIICIISNSYSLKEVAAACVPVFSGEYWYMTTYMLLMIFSDYINKIPEKMSKKEFEKLIVLIFFVFSVIPTVVQFHVMNDGGKGLANMLLMYFLGRYIRIYKDEERKQFKFSIISISIIMLEFILNLLLTMLRGGVGIYAPFARDCSCIIVIASVSIFMSFNQFRFYSKTVNKIAKHVVAVYLFEDATRRIIECYFNLALYKEEWYLFMVIAVYVFGVLCICIIVDLIRIIIMKPIETALYKGVEKVIHQFQMKKTIFKRIV